MDAPRRRPNILLIVSDDHGYADRGPSEEFRTPALDRLAFEGVTCDHAYVTAPICSPSRAGLITGLHQVRWGAEWFESSNFAPDGVPTLAEHLRERGYATGYFGKVHYGTADAPGTRACPPHHGFDESFYGLSQAHKGRLNYLHRGAEDAEAYGEAAAFMGVGTLWEGTQEVAPSGFLTDLIADRAERFIVDHSRAATSDDAEDAPDGGDAPGSPEDPWFAMVAFNAVHNFCWQLPAAELERRGLPPHTDWDPASQPYLEWYDDVIAPNLPHGREYYLAQLELMDAAIGRLLGTLDRLGVAEDTVVVYLTDNGGSACNYGDNGVLRGTKYTLWEGGIRVPFLVRWPAGGVPAGERRTGLVSSLDLTPTLLAATGEPLDGDTDGLDQWALLRDGAAGHDELHWSTGFAWATRRGDWKLSYVDPDDTTAREFAAVEHAPLGSGPFLADLARDPGERDDRVPDRRDVVAELAAGHRRWRDSIGRPVEHPPTVAL